MKKVIICLLAVLLVFTTISPSLKVAAEEAEVNGVDEKSVQEVLKILEELDKQYKRLYKILVDGNNSVTPYDYDYVVWYVNYTKAQGFPQFGKEVYEMWQGWLSDTLMNIQRLWYQLQRYDQTILENSEINNRINNLISRSQETNLYFSKKLRDKLSLGLTKENITFLSALKTTADIEKNINDFVVNGAKISDFFKGKLSEAATEQLAAEMIYQLFKGTLDEKHARNMAQKCSGLFTVKNRLGMAVALESCLGAEITVVEEISNDTKELENAIKKINTNAPFTRLHDSDVSTADLFDLYEKSEKVNLRSLIGTWEVKNDYLSHKATISINENSNGVLNGTINFPEKNITVPLTISKEINKAILRFPVTSDYLTAYYNNLHKEIIKQVVEKGLTQQYEIILTEPIGNVLEGSFRDVSFSYNKNSYKFSSWRHGYENMLSHDVSFKLVNENQPLILPKRENISPTKTWTVTFSQRLDSATINTENVTVLNANRERLNNIRVSLENQTKLSVSIDGSYEKGTYYLLIGANVKSANGQSLKQAVELPFSVSE